MIWLFTCGGLLWLGAAMWTGRWNSRKVVLLFLLVWFLSQVVVAVLGDGLVALEQHLLSARLALDLFFLIFVLDLAAAAMASRRQPLSNEEGCASPQKASVSA
jgi:hypothetical protein